MMTTVERRELQGGINRAQRQKRAGSLGTAEIKETAPVSSGQLQES